MISSLQDFQSFSLKGSSPVALVTPRELVDAIHDALLWSQARESFVLLMAPYWNVYCFTGIPTKDGREESESYYFCLV